MNNFNELDDIYFDDDKECLCKIIKRCIKEGPTGPTGPTVQG